VARNSVAISRKPAVTTPASSVYMTSFSSSGASVEPFSLQCAMCTPNST
jgi:hypothetical protein